MAVHCCDNAKMPSSMNCWSSVVDVAAVDAAAAAVDVVDVAAAAVA